MSLKSQSNYWFGKELKAYEHESLTVTNAALKFTVTKLSASGKENAVRAFVTVETKNIRYRIDGTDPSASSGHLVYAGGTIVIEGKTNITRFRAHRVDIDAKIQVTYQRYE